MRCDTCSKRGNPALHTVRILLLLLLHEHFSLVVFACLELLARLDSIHTPMQRCAVQLYPSVVVVQLGTDQLLELGASMGLSPLILKCEIEVIHATVVCQACRCWPAGSDYFSTLMLSCQACLMTKAALELRSVSQAGAEASMHDPESEIQSNIFWEYSQY